MQHVADVEVLWTSCRSVVFDWSSIKSVACRLKTVFRACLDTPNISFGNDRAWRFSRVLSFCVLCVKKKGNIDLETGKFVRTPS